MIVVDASVMVELLLDTELGRRADARVMGAEARHAPHLLDVEVAQALRRFVLAGQLPVARAQQAIADLTTFPITRHSHTALIDRMFELRANVTAYDAAYMALAEALGATFVTCDSALAKVPRSGARVELVA